jgi:glucan 1,3-beta-glucosidase
VIATAWATEKRRCPSGLRVTEHAFIGAIAAIGGMMLGLAVEAAAYESLGWSGWLRSGMLVAVSVASPVVASSAIAARLNATAISNVIGPREARVSDSLARALGWVVVATSVLALESALSLTFNPRYLDFPYAAMTCAVAPLIILTLTSRPRVGPFAAAEFVIAALLALCAIKVAWMETLTNWQSVWLCLAFLALSFTLLRARAEQG